MSYYRLENICNNYKEPSTALINNHKYTNPYVDSSEKVANYYDDSFNLNSYEYNNNNFYIKTKSYKSIDVAYKNGSAKTDASADVKQQLLDQEKKLIDATEKELKALEDKKSPSNKCSSKIK